jgi:hypothetical protein
MATVLSISFSTKLDLGDRRESLIDFVFGVLTTGCGKALQPVLRA